MGIGKTLSEILSEQNRNPNELAERIGESSSTIYSIIRRDNTKVDISVLARICEELNVDMERFYSDYIQDKAQSNQLHLSDHEKQVILAYRQQPSMQEAVDRLLGVSESETKEKRA